ncbi:MAG: AsmA family protein [Betaproteobacteria bacterium]
MATTRRRPVAWMIAALIGVPLGVVLVVAILAVAVALSGRSIDVSRWRDAAAERASTALGRPVLLQGAFELEPRLGREFGLRIGSLRILNPPGFEGKEFLAIGELRARIDLFDALRGRLRSSSIEARDVGLWLERNADGRGNWTPTTQRDDREAQPAIDIARIELKALDVQYHDARSATRRVVRVEELTGGGGRDRPLRLAARGRLEPGLAYSLSIEGGPLRLLQDDAEAWPFAFDVRTTGARLHARGALDARQRVARFQVEADVDDPAAIERLAGSALSRFGSAALHATVSVEADSVRVSRLHAWLGDSELSGQLALAFGGARPRLGGALSVATLDLDPFLAAAPSAWGHPLESDAPARQSPSLRDLAAFDVEVDVTVARWLGLGVDVRDATLAWRADARGLRVPLSATVAGVPFAGGLELDTAAPMPTLALRLDANDAALGSLAQGLGHSGVAEGTIGRIGLRVDGRGETLASLARDLEFSVALAAAQLSLDGTADGGRIAVSLDTLDLAARRGERVRGRARGTLLGQPARLTFRGGTVPDMLRERALPLELDLALARARLQVDGAVAFAESTRDTALRFDFRAERAGDFARWLGIAPQSSLPVALRGHVRRSDEAWTLDRTTLEVGRSRLTIDARSAVVDGRPGIAASVRSELIDAQELSTLRAGSADRRGDAGGDAPGSAAAIDLGDADIDVKLQRLRLGRTDLEDLAFVARTRDGRPLPLSVTGKVAGAPFRAGVELDLRAQPPAASLDLSAGAIDIGALLRGLGVAEDIDGQAQAFRLSVAGRGSSLGEWVGHSAVEARVQGGRLTVLGAAQRPVTEIRVDEARVGAKAGGPVRAWLGGRIDETPVRIEVTSGTLVDFAADASRVPFALTARAADAQLKLEGAVTLPLGSGGQLSFEMQGERLDALSDLAQVELPPWGPWSLSGPVLRMTPSGYELQGLDVRVGRSRLTGSGKLDLGGPRPYLDVQVAAPSIQLDDFPLPQQLVDPSAPPAGGRGLRATASRTAGRTHTLLSAAFLRRLDATVDVKAKEVLSGSDRLADGTLRLQLAEGRLHLDPALVNLPGGAVRLAASYDLKGTDIEFAATASIERFEYGIIARRLGRGDDIRGLFSLNAKLAGTAPSLNTIMRHASGRVDIAVWPTELRSGVFNLWSANLVLQLLPLVDTRARPEINCIVGRFDLERGDLNDDVILVDTTAVRIRGVGHANLATEELEFVFRPRAKGFALFRLQTPLRVTGTLDDQRFGFERSDVPESVLRLIASPILLPIERLTLGPLPRDGADVCTDPLRAMAR